MIFWWKDKKEYWDMNEIKPKELEDKMNETFLLSMKLEVRAEEKELREFIQEFKRKYKILKGTPQIRKRGIY